MIVSELANLADLGRKGPRRPGRPGRPGRRHHRHRHHARGRYGYPAYPYYGPTYYVEEDTQKNVLTDADGNVIAVVGRIFQIMPGYGSRPATPAEAAVKRALPPVVEKPEVSGIF